MTQVDRELLPVMMAAVVSDFGRRIRLRRQALGLTQEEFARKVGVDVSSVIAWEKQKHKPTRWQGKIEAVLGISLSPDAPAIDPHLQRMIDALSPEEKQLLIAELTGQAPPPPRNPQSGRGEAGRHRAAG